MGVVSDGEWLACPEATASHRQVKSKEITIRMMVTAEEAQQ